MVKTKSGFILATTAFSGIAVLLSITSLATEEWITAKGEFTGGNNDPLSSIEYGLFSGTFKQILGSPVVFQISMTCVIEENACAYICEVSAEARKQQLKQLIRGENVQFNIKCPKVARINDIVYSPSKTRNTSEKREFLNAGLYISTVVFLCISVVFGLISTILSFYNLIANPIEVYFSTSGLYIYTAIACVACIFALCLWSVLYGTMIIDNVGIYYTIRNQMNTKGWTQLGYSYWLLLPSCLLYLTSIISLYIRQYLINQEPKIKIHTTSGEADVGEIMIY